MSVGNGSVHDPGQPTTTATAVLELAAPPARAVLRSGSWASDNANDLDMSTAPVLLADGQVILAGKSRSSTS